MVFHCIATDFPLGINKYLGENMLTLCRHFALHFPSLILASIGGYCVQVITVGLAYCDFSNSIFPSIFINWNSVVRKSYSFPFPIFCVGMDLQIFILFYELKFNIIIYFAS